MNPISCHLITWGNDLDTGMKEAAQLGFRACETFTHLALEYENRREQFRETLAGHGLALSALYGGGRFSDPDQARQVVAYNTRVAQFLAGLGVDRIVFGPRGPRTGKTTPGEIRQIARTMNEAARRTADLGVLACMHPHLGTEIQDQDEIEALLEATDPDCVHFCPDTAHLTAAGMDAAHMIRKYGDRIQYFHLKDLTPTDADTSTFADWQGDEALPIFCELGLGTIDFVPIMAAIREVGYTGWLTVEIDQSTSTPYQSLQQCRDYIQSTLGLSIDGEPAPSGVTR
jgi:inosose dehydratase